MSMSFEADDTTLRLSKLLDVIETEAGVLNPPLPATDADIQSRPLPAEESPLTGFLLLFALSAMAGFAFTYLASDWLI
jgi:hypothetical protein